MKICATRGCNNSVDVEYAIVEGEKVCIPCVKKLRYI